MKNVRELERVTKGVANHRRIAILSLLGRQPGLTLGDIADRLHINMKTAAEHLRRLAAAGLVEKRYEGRSVCHTLTSVGRNILTFLRKLE